MAAIKLQDIVLVLFRLVQHLKDGEDVEEMKLRYIYIYILNPIKTLIKIDI